jgi:hypothetical protein
MISKLENVEPVAEVESLEDRTRRLWAESGAPYAHLVVLFLQGKRRLAIQAAEIVATQTYARSDEIEKRALRMVCESAHEIPPSPDDSQALRYRDYLLLDIVDGKVLGHRDTVQQLRSIPEKVAEQAHWDKAFFGGRVYTSPILFRWVWER